MQALRPRSDGVRPLGYKRGNRSAEEACAMPSSIPDFVGHRHRWPARFVLVALVAVVALVAGCGGGGGSAPDGDPFPLAVGSRWETEITQSVSSGPALPQPGSREVVGSFTLAGETTWALELRDAGVRQEWYQRSEHALVRVPTPQDTALEQAVGPRVMLQLPLVVGAQWVQVDTQVITGDYLDVDGQPLPTRVQARAEVVALEPVTVPAGSFRNAFRLRYAERQETDVVPDAYTAWFEQTTTQWLVPGIGVVRSVTESVNHTSLRTHLRTEVLLAYRPPPAPR
jgi:hypothetical protein